MANSPVIHTFTFKELAEALVKQIGIQEGLWGIYVKFGITATNIGPNPQEIKPAAVIPIIEIGIQEFKEKNSLTVDANKITSVRRKFYEVSEDELSKAVERMAIDLGISGSAGGYSLYNAMQSELKKAKDFKDQSDEPENKPKQP